jgi:predicted metal-binding protein
MPAHVPTFDEFRELLKEYRSALHVKFRSPAVAGEEIAKAPY